MLWRDTAVLLLTGVQGSKGYTLKLLLVGILGILMKLSYSDVILYWHVLALLRKRLEETQRIQYV